MKFLKLIFNPAKKLESVGVWVLLTLTIVSIIYKQTTVFYIIYLFWFSEVLRTIVDLVFFKKPSLATQATPAAKLGISPRFFLLGIYWVFIVVFFGLIANYDNDAAMNINFQVVSFQNIFFNLNLMFIVIERIIYHRMNRNLEPSYDAFTANMIVLHVSIILGGALTFFLVLKYEKTFSPENLWGSVLIISPFLLLRMLIRGDD